MAKVTVVNSAWTKRRAFLVGIVVAAISVALSLVLIERLGAWSLAMPGQLFVPLLFGISLSYPIATLVYHYPRLPNALAGVLYALGFGVGSFLTVATPGAVESILGSGGPTAWDWITTKGSFFVRIVSIGIGVNLATWGLCRVFRGEVVVQDGTLCWGCGYSLVGNVSGRCPECGESLPT